MRSGQANPKAGYTLVEVLVALVLIAVILPVVMQGTTLALATGRHARAQAEAAELARAKLDELVVTAKWQSGQLSGEFEESPDFKWTAALTSFGTESLVQQLDVEVTWKERNQDHSVVLSTLVYEAESE